MARFFSLAPEAAAIAIFAMTYLVVAIGRLPGFRLDRAGAALVGASQSAAVRVLPSGQWLGRHPCAVSDRVARRNRIGLGNPLGLSGERYGLPGPDAARPRPRDPAASQPRPLSAGDRNGIECWQHGHDHRQPAKNDHRQSVAYPL